MTVKHTFDSDFLLWEGLLIFALFVCCTFQLKDEIHINLHCLFPSSAPSLSLSVCLCHLVADSIHKIFHSCSVHVNRTTTLFGSAYCLCGAAVEKATPQLLFLFRDGFIVVQFMHEKRAKRMCCATERSYHTSKFHVNCTKCTVHTHTLSSEKQ